MKRIVSVLGARPQFIKAAVLSRIIEEKKEIEEIIVHTGQHYDQNMSQVFFDEMHIPAPKYNLNINGLTHGAMTGQMLEKIEEVLLVEKPDMVVVYGDTNSTLAGALAAKKLGIKVAHIEAGLRSFNRGMPEEINRILTDRVSDLLICPSQTSVDNLRAEGIPDAHSKVELCGDIMKDSVDYFRRISSEHSTVIDRLSIGNRAFVLSTIHRQELTENIPELRSVLKGLNRICEDRLVVLPLHPRTKQIFKDQGFVFKGLLIDPVGYLDMLELLKNCEMVITDSGGLQKEAYFNKKPLLIIRNETEWVELVDNNFAKLVGHDDHQIVQGYHEFKPVRIESNSHLYGAEPGLEIYSKIIENV